MKTVNFFKVAFLSALVGVAFTSCKDDKEEKGTGSGADYAASSEVNGNQPLSVEEMNSVLDDVVREIADAVRPRTLYKVKDIAAYVVKSDMLEFGEAPTAKESEVSKQGIEVILDRLQTCLVDLGGLSTGESVPYEIKYEGSSRDIYDYIQNIVKLSPFTGKFTYNEESGWDYSDAKYLSFSFRGPKGTPVEVKLEASGDQSPFYVMEAPEAIQDFLPEEIEEFDEETGVWYGSINAIYISVPKKLNFTLSENGQVLVGISVVSNMITSNNRLQFNKDNYSGSFKLTVGDVEADFQQVAYNPGKTTDLKFQMRKAGKPLVGVSANALIGFKDAENPNAGAYHPGMWIEGEGTVEDLDDLITVGKASLAINLCGKIQVKASVASVDAIRAFAEEEDNVLTKEYKSKTAAEEAAALVNAAYNFGVYVGNGSVNQATVKIQVEEVKEVALVKASKTYVLVPVIVLGDGSEYSFSKGEEIGGLIDRFNSDAIMFAIESLMQDYQMFMQEAERSFRSDEDYY